MSSTRPNAMGVNSRIEEEASDAMIPRMRDLRSGMARRSTSSVEGTFAVLAVFAVFAEHRIGWIRRNGVT